MPSLSQIKLNQHERSNVVGIYLYSKQNLPLSYKVNSYICNELNI